MTIFAQRLLFHSMPMLLPSYLKTKSVKIQESKMRVILSRLRAAAAALNGREHKIRSWREERTELLFVKYVSIWNCTHPHNDYLLRQTLHTSFVLLCDKLLGRGSGELLCNVRAVSICDRNSLCKHISGSSKNNWNVGIKKKNAVKEWLWKGNILLLQALFFY